jgi:hypothetical protein
MIVDYSDNPELATSEMALQVEAILSRIAGNGLY